MRYVFGLLCVCALGVAPLVGCDETQPECQSAEDCSDGNECTEDVCDPVRRTCSNPPLNDGTDCTFDGTDGVCVSGVCGENLCEGVVCEDDGNECTADVCNFADGTCGVPVENGAACSGGACLDGTCTSLATVSGTVDFGGAPPGEGSQITVSVDGTSLSTTTDVSGGFSFEVFPGEWFFVTSKEDTVWGEIALISVPSTGQSNLQFMVGFDEEVAVYEEECGVEFDEAKGFVGFYFVPVSGAGGETVTLSVPYGGGLTEDADGNCVVSETILPGAANPFGSMELEFFNVDLTENLVVTPIAPEGYACALEHPGTVFPVRASFVSGGDVRCMSVP